MRLSRTVLILIGTASISSAALGIWFNASSLQRVSNWLDFLAAPRVPPYFFPVFYAMSAISVSCNSLLLACGIQYVRSRSNWDGVFVVVMVFELLYLTFMRLAGASIPEIGAAVEACKGVANGGLMPQVIILLPLWAPPVAIWAGKRTGTASRQTAVK